MIISVYLHENVLNTLTCFGDLSEVTDRVLKEFYEHKVDFYNAPKCPDRSLCKRVTINITYLPYLNEIEAEGIKNKNLSLSRILTYFADNEYYNTYEWSIPDTKILNDKLAILLDLHKLRTIAIKLNNLNVLHSEDLLKIIERIEKSYE